MKSISLAINLFASCLKVLFGLDLSLGIVCREIGLVGWFYTTTKLPPFLYRVALFSTAAATTNFHLSEGIWLFSHWLRLLATFLAISLGLCSPPPPTSLPFFPLFLGSIIPATSPISPRGTACYQECLHCTLGSPEQHRTPTPSISAMPPPSS